MSDYFKDSLGKRVPPWVSDPGVKRSPTESEQFSLAAKIGKIAAELELDKYLTRTNSDYTELLNSLLDTYVDVLTTIDGPALEKAINNELPKSGGSRKFRQHGGATWGDVRKAIKDLLNRVVSTPVQQAAAAAPDVALTAINAITLKNVMASASTVYFIKGSLYGFPSLNWLIKPMAAFVAALPEAITAAAANNLQNAAQFATLGGLSVGLLFGALVIFMIARAGKVVYDKIKEGTFSKAQIMFDVANDYKTAFGFAADSDEAKAMDTAAAAAAVVAKMGTTGDDKDATATAAEEEGEKTAGEGYSQDNVEKISQAKVKEKAHDEASIATVTYKIGILNIRGPDTDEEHKRLADKYTMGEISRVIKVGAAAAASHGGGRRKHHTRRHKRRHSHKRRQTKKYTRRR